MADFSVVLIENGFPPSIPGFLTDTPAATFPMWGNFTFLDLIMTNFLHKKIKDINIFIQNRYRKCAPFIAGRWKDELQNIIILENEIDDITNFLKQLQTDYIMICSLLLVSLFNAGDILDVLKDHSRAINKIAIDNHPLHFYIIQKKMLIRYIEENKSNYTAEKGISHFLFSHILDKHFETIIDIPGIVFFTHSIMQLYRGNLWLMQNLRNKFFLDVLLHTSHKLPGGKESIVREQGLIKNSYLSPGVEIEGYVENSILFPNVVVNKKTEIINSVIMNNNSIGRNSHVQNAIILPNESENANILFNIGDNTVIGGKSSMIKNRDFPDQIYNGLSVLGMNAHVPRGFTIEQSSFLGPHIPIRELKERKLLKKGASLCIKNMETNE